jgi:hypothetical protein
LKPRAPFIWTAEQPIDPLGFQAVYRQAPPRATGTNRWFLFRHEFDLNGRPDTAPARVTVDGRYQLFVNGVRVGRGPIRCSPLFQRYDLYDLAPYLQTGRNALGLIVHTYGVDTAWYETVKGMWSHTFGDGAVWLEGEAETAEHTVLLDTGPDWRCLQADAAWRTDTQRMNSGLGFIEAMDARGMPEGWLRPGFDDSTWTRVQELKAGGGGPDALFGGFETRPFPTLIPRSIPTLEERPVIPERLVWIKGLVPNPNLPIERRCYEEALRPAPNQAVDEPQRLLSPHAGVVVRTAENCDIALLFDFGRLLTGYPRIEIDARGGESIEIACSEHLPGEWEAGGAALDARITPVPFLGLDAHVCRYTARPGRQVFERFEWSAIRWMQVTIRDAPQGLTIWSIGATFTAYPVTEAGRFSCSDPFLTRLWKVGAYTLRLCMHDSWEDCPSREQRQWLGDATVENLVGHAAFGPCIAPLNALFLRQVAESQRPDGLTQMYAPGDHHTNGLLIPDWTLQWILNAGDHWLYTGDIDTIEAILPSIERALAWFDHHLSPAGLVADMPYWHFMDWAAVGREAEACVLNAQLAGCFDVAATFAAALGYEHGRTKYSARAGAIRAALNLRHWDERRGCFVDMVDPRSGVQRLRVSQHAFAAMALWGGVPADRLVRNLARVTDPRRLVFTPAPPITTHSATFDEHEDVVLANTFYAHFLYSALADAGRLDQAIMLMRSKLGPMIAKGSSTLWESLEPTASLCHGFSASPTYQLSSRLLGVRPAAPGFTAARVEPNLSGLDYAEGAVPTPFGNVDVALEKTSSGFSAVLRAPEGIALHVAAPPGLLLEGGPRVCRGTATLSYSAQP